MTLDNLLSLLTSGLVLILVGIFLAPIIRDWSSHRQRQESHTPLEDLVKKRERWIQVQGLAGPNQAQAWKERFPSESSLIEGFLIWGDPKLLDQVNQGLDNKLGPEDLRARLAAAPPHAGEMTLIEALSLPTLPTPEKSEKNDQSDS